ncbi:hypothetical protein [Halochromatium glycolicum]|uniref:hypothetical protein n=1 Tax=Halochromatium glycolicum TaxID=85075 RepID=UPI00190A0B4E|nr:hypothetical protein [Halochromatium glycolicum]
MIPPQARDYVDMVDRVCRQHGIEPLITLTSLSERCFDSTVPLLFNRNHPAEIERAHNCHRALLNGGKALGCIPYRSNTQTMDWFVNADHSHWRLVRQLKEAVDPEGVIAPGRYCLP